MKTNADGTFNPLFRTILDSTPAPAKQDTRKIAMNQFLGFLGGNGKQKYLDTSICGNVRITFTFDSASRVLIRSASTAQTGAVGDATESGIDNASIASPTYTLNNVLS